MFQVQNYQDLKKGAGKVKQDLKKEIIIMYKKKLPMELQFFADDSDDSDDSGDNLGAHDSDDGDNKGEEGNIDNDEKDERTEQQKINDAVKERLARADKKHEAELAKVKEKAKADAVRYAEMTESEKSQAELQDRLDELEDREKELNNRELLGNIRTDLSEKGLPVVFADTLLEIQDNEKIKESITEIKKVWDEEINEAVKASVRQKTPSSSTQSYRGTDKKNESKKEFFDSGRKI